MTYQQAKIIAKKITGREPRWCDVRGDDGEFQPAPIAEAMDDCISLDARGNQAAIDYWINERPVSPNAEAVCYF